MEYNMKLVSHISSNLTTRILNVFVSDSKGKEVTTRFNKNQMKRESIFTTKKVKIINILHPISR